MKALSVLLGLFFVLNAQAQFGLSQTETSDVTCSLQKASGQLENGTPVFPCASKDSSFGIVFASVKMDLRKAASAGSNLQLKLHCTVKNPKGAFVFGGETIGFETATNKHGKYLYAVGEGNYGRCFISADAGLTANLQFTVNQSGVGFVVPKAKVVIYQ